MTDEEVLQDMIRMKRGMRTTKVVATCAIKGQFGETFLGISSEWESIQLDGTRGMDDLDIASKGGLNAFETKKASLLLGLQCDTSAHLNAVARGNMDATKANNIIQNLTVNYTRQYKALCEQAEKSKKEPK